MLKLELLVGVKLAQAEPLLVLLDGMETGAVAWRQSTHLLQKKHLSFLQQLLTQLLAAPSCCLILVLQ